jgi:transcriptional regulator with XRE-family HTH domain
MAERRVKLSDQVRRAVDASGLSRYRIAKEIHVAESTMSRFMSGRTGLSMEYLDRLADLLGLDISVRRPTTKG